MKKCKFLAFALLLTLALLSASAGRAQTVLSAVGSSGVFATTGLAAITPDPVTTAPALCGTNFWSGGSGSASSTVAFGHDGRNVGIPDEPGTLWVAWDNNTSPTKICTYLSVDSVVGQRLFFDQTGSGNATQIVLAKAQYTVGANKVSFAADTCAVSNNTLAFAVDINQPSGNTATVTVHPSGNFSDYFANGASVTITGSTVSAFNATYDGGAGHQPAISGVTAFDPTQFSIVTTAVAPASDTTGGATATVTPTTCPGIPAAVYSHINGASAHFTMAFTDIRPEDAHATFVRATCPIIPNDNFTTCMGYSSSPSAPQAVKSSYSQDVAFGLDYALPGNNDPITTVPVPAATIADVGALPVMVIVSNRNTTACGFGNAAFTSITIPDLRLAYTGQAFATQDVSPALVSIAAGCPTAMYPIEREPFSGTYNTFEFQSIRAQGWSGQGRFSQENGNVGYPQSNRNSTGSCPSWVSSLPTTTASNPVYPPNGSALPGPPTNNIATFSCGNPLNIVTANYGTDTAANSALYGGFTPYRTRAIGTGQVVSVVNSTNVIDALGYGFYSLGTFGGKANVKYVAVNGADPLWPGYPDNPYGAGVFPTCTGKVNTGGITCPHGQPTFDGVVNGGYPIWNIIRAVYYGGVSTCSAPFTTVSAGCLIQAAQDQANPSNGNVRDYLPVVYCANSSCSSTNRGISFFRSHYNVSGVTGHDGNNAGPPCNIPESGGDVAGTPFPVNYDVTLASYIGCSVEQTGFFQ